MNILVTGSSGFIGKNLVNYLEDLGHQVIPYDIKTGQDILDGIELASTFYENHISRVYHLSAQAFMSTGENYPYRDLDVNGKGMINILRMVEKFRVPMVYTSSGAVYGQTDSYPHSEDALLKPRANYGCSKRYAELLLQKWVATKYVDCKVVRFSSVYGPYREHGPVNIFINKALKGEPLTVYGDGSQTRDMIYIDDALRGMIKVLELGSPGEIYNVGYGKEHSVTEVALIIQGITGSEIKFIPHQFSEFDVKRSYYNIDKVRSLSWEPKYDLVEGIERTYNIMSYDNIS